jgi:DNA recombination protein RmuC
MGGYMSQIVPFVLGTVIGVAVGGLLVWLVMRRGNRIRPGQPTEENQIEVIRLNERLSSVTADLAQSRENVRALEGKTSDLSSQLSAARDARTRFEERAARVPLLESQLLNSAAETQQVAEHLTEAREKFASSASTAEGYREQIVSLDTQISGLRDKCDRLLSDQEGLRTNLAESTITLDSERKQATEKLALIDDAKQQLTDRFRALANDILEEKAKRFTEQNQTNIGQILEPLKLKIHEFQGKVEQVYVQESMDRTALAEQVKQLLNLNQQLSQDANNLTQALKGSNKPQGNWGELVLERILEVSGLRKGHEYDLRENYSRDEGSRAQPDVVIHLPENKQLIVDSKMSLKAYDAYYNAHDESTRAEAIKRHADSVRQHIKNLSTQDYHRLEGQRSLDFVIMFVPVEPAYILALAHDSSLWEDAWKRNVLLVGPSTLLFVVRTVAHLWRQERQNHNVQEIVKRGAELYDKLCGFVEDLSDVGKRLNQARTSYENAYVKFSTGRGNVIRQAETLKDLGIKPSKTLPQDILESAQDDPLSLPGVGDVHGAKPD